MTLKERIEAFVKQQGNQVGAGAELAAILNDIVDAIPGEYTLPPASAQTLGGIKVGENLSITEQGVLSASGGGSGALIVAGIINVDAIFAPNEGQPTLAEAHAAIAQGRDVIVFANNQYWHWSFSAIGGIQFISPDGSIIWPEQ